MIRLALAVLAACCGLTANSASAQETATRTAEQVSAEAEAVYGPADSRAKPACPAPTPGGEIVVCGETEDSSKYRVQSSGDLDPTGKGASGPPRAPDLFNLPVPPMVGLTMTTKGCFIPPCPSPMPLLIDLKAIPEAPPGSDADRVGRGLAPRGGPDTAVTTPVPAPTPGAGPAAAATPPESASPAEVPSGSAPP